MPVEALAEIGSLVVAVIAILIGVSRTRKNDFEAFARAIRAEITASFAAHEKHERELFASKTDFEVLGARVEDLRDDLRELRDDVRRDIFAHRRGRRRSSYRPPRAEPDSEPPEDENEATG